MRIASLIAPLACGMLVFSLASDAAAQGGGERRSGWYIGGGVGADWTSDIDQSGSNRDPVCYPTNACFDEDPRPTFSGYRWGYVLELDRGVPFELSAGFIVNHLRLEGSFAQRVNNINQNFRSASLLDGTSLPARAGTTVGSETSAFMDDLAVRTLAFNAYYDFRTAATGLSPYVGAGVGPAFVDIRGVHFSEMHYDTASDGAAYDPPLSYYDSRLNTDFSDTVIAGHLHAGVDYGLSARLALGAKLTYSMLGEVEHTGRYDLHAASHTDPDFTHTDTFTGARSWSLLFTARYTFGN